VENKLIECMVPLTNHLLDHVTRILEFSAGVEEVRTVVDEVLFKGGAFVLEINKLGFQFNDSSVELVHGDRPSRSVGL
jgi:5-methylthioribose kinase